MTLSIKGHSVLVTASITMLCLYAGCRLLFIIMLNVVMLSVIMPNQYTVCRYAGCRSTEALLAFCLSVKIKFSLLKRHCLFNSMDMK
jgi:hypothetical protein